MTLMIEGLVTDGPDPKLSEELIPFGQFVGDWEILEARYPQPDGSEIKRRGEVHFGWILDGKAVQENHMITRRHGSSPRKCKFAEGTQGPRGNPERNDLLTLNRVP